MKYKLHIVVLSVFSIVLFFSCENDEKVESWDKPENKDSLNNVQKPFVTDTIVVRNLFDETNFENDTLSMLLSELGICNPDVAAKFDLYNPPCLPRYYKFFKYSSKLWWSDGFALEIRAGLDDFPLRRFLIFERVNGKLIKLNAFAANLVEKHTTPSGYYDLMLLFRDEEAGSFVVKYKWENQKYEYASVEVIDGYLVKESRKDSLSDVVLKRLIKNKMIF